MSQNFGKVRNKILVKKKDTPVCPKILVRSGTKFWWKKKTPSVVTVGLGWPAASRELNEFLIMAVSAMDFQAREYIIRGIFGKNWMEKFGYSKIYIFYSAIIGRLEKSEMFDREGFWNKFSSVLWSKEEYLCKVYFRNLPNLKLYDQYCHICHGSVQIRSFRIGCGIRWAR